MILYWYICILVILRQFGTKRGLSPRFDRKGILRTLYVHVHMYIVHNTVVNNSSPLLLKYTRDSLVEEERERPLGPRCWSAGGSWIT